MPRQLDLTPGNLRLGNNPNVQLAVTGDQINNIFAEFNNLAQLTIEAIEEFINTLLGYIDQVTGLDLVSIAKIFEQLSLDFSSPEAFIQSLITAITQLPSIVVQLLESLIVQLVDAGNSDLLQNLITAAIDLLLSLPSLLQQLFAPLINLLLGGFTSGGILTGSSGTLTQVLTDFMGILGNPGGLGSGSPILPATGSIPLLGDMLTLIETIPGAAQAVLDTIVQTFLGLGGSGFSTADLSRALQSIPANLLTGSMPAGMLSHLNIGTLSSVIPEFLTNPNFDTPNSIIGQSVWTWDGTTGPGGGVLTSVFATATGTLKELLSNTIAVAPGQSLAISGNTQWTGFTGAANSIALTVSKFDPAGLFLGYDTIGSIASPGTSGGWTLLSGTYTVPSGVAAIQLRPTITAGATAGKVWFGKLSVKQTATTLLGGLVPLLDASKIGSGTFPLTMTGAQSIIDGIFQPLTGSAATGNPLSAMTAALGVIPIANVTGHGGPSTAADTHQTLWDQLVSGLARTPGTTGTSPSIVATAAQNVASTVSTHTSDIASLWSAVHALGGAGGGMAPVTVQMNASGTYPIPAGAGHVDVIALGGGAGGQCGGFLSSSAGGDAGTWNTATLTVTSQTSMTVTIGGGGNGGSGAPNAPGGNGGNTTITATGFSVTATGGTPNSSGPVTGASPGNVPGAYGGTTQTVAGGNGSTPGGGGAGGAANQAGGNGAPGTVVLTARA